MKSERIEQAVQRIETALSRIAEIADNGSAAGEGSGAVPANVSQLVVKHEELREAVASEIRQLDALIERLGG